MFRNPKELIFKSQMSFEIHTSLDIATWVILFLSKLDICKNLRKKNVQVSGDKRFLYKYSINC